MSWVARPHANPWMRPFDNHSSTLRSTVAVACQRSDCCWVSGAPLKFQLYHSRMLAVPDLMAAYNFGAARLKLAGSPPQRPPEARKAKAARRREKS